jgi:hypothetical protein
VYNFLSLGGVGVYGRREEGEGEEGEEDDDK